MTAAKGSDPVTFGMVKLIILFKMVRRRVGERSPRYLVRRWSAKIYQNGWGLWMFISIRAVEARNAQFSRYAARKRSPHFPQSASSTVAHRTVVQPQRHLAILVGLLGLGWYASLKRRNAW